ncbi:MAG: GAF domain-containing SpoIIE family protein phosphatase [Opitutaceae bacterium]|jgi:sigma-B regulation protein RsbU (phosphoserine phosphatase)
MLLELLLGAAIGGLLMLVPVLRARAFARRQEEERQQFAQDRQRVIDFMRLMAEAQGEGLSPQELRQRIVHASIICTGALSACMFEKTPADTMRGVAVEGLFPPHRPLPAAIGETLTTRAKFIEQVLKSEEFPIGEGVVGRVARTGRPELIADAASDARIVRHDDRALAVQSVIAVPLRFRDRFFGVLAVANPADDRPFAEVEFSLLQSLADQAALALHNAELLDLRIEKSKLDLDLSIASGIQQMLLPLQAVSFKGLDLDARYKPAQKIGGDLYDVIQLPGGRLGVAVADVSGKGIPASLTMAIARTHMRQIAPRHESPARALAELNRAVAQDVRGGVYVTVLYAVIDGARGQVVIARAGHELPLLARIDAAGACRPAFIGSEGMPIGLVPDEMFTLAIADQVEPFARGDILVLYTDGITEAPNEDGKEFSGARLADAVRQRSGRSAREINDGILEAVQGFVGDVPQQDDLTLVTVRHL